MRTRILLTIAATATILAGCSNEETNEAIDNWNGEIRLSSGIAVQTRAETPSDQGQQIAANQEVGVFINSEATGNAAIGTANQKYTADGEGKLTIAQSGTTPYYPSDGSKVTIIAYQPYNSSAAIASSPTYDFSVQTNQNGNSNGDYYDSDLLYVKSTGLGAKKEQALTFEHQLSKVICTLENGDGITAVTGATVKIADAKIKGTFNPSSAAFTITSGSTQGTDISDVTMNSAITSGKYIAVIPPQTFAASTAFLQVTIGDATYTYKPTSGITLAAKTAYSYKIKVKATGLTVTSSITPWTDGSSSGETTGDATMDEPASGGGNEGGGENP